MGGVALAQDRHDNHANAGDFPVRAIEG